MRKLLLSVFVSGFLFSSFSGTAGAGKFEVIPVLGSVVGVPVALSRLLACEDPSRRRTIRPIPLRSFSAYGLDPASRERFWIEMGGEVGRFKDSDLLFESRVYTASAFCGYRKAEFGFSLPYLRLDGETGGTEFLELGVGDSHVFGKMIFERKGGLTYALGYRVLLPSGREEDGLGTGDLGLMPFVSAGKEFKALALRSYTGFEMLNESQGSHPDTFLYGGGFSIRLSKNIAFRTDVNGSRSNSRDGLSVDPGMDFQLSAKSVSLIFRSNYAHGLTKDTEDYRIGGSFVFAQR